ncbi:MAG: TIGR01212 family radical SAM protein [Desulfovibrionaceae bacterium]
MPEKLPYLSMATHLRRRFGQRVQKIPLDAGFSCPNRDGTISRNGCLFCNSDGSGSGLLRQGLDLHAQWLFWREEQSRKCKANIFLAYLQSFSNTHGSPDRLRRVLERIEHLPDRVGLCIGTRPDCLDAEKLDLLAALPGETWLELGLQSSNNATLKRINRGHSAEDFAAATRKASTRGLQVCAHVIAGLPGEDADDFLATIDYVNALPVAGIKLHNLYVAKGAPLEKIWRAGGYTPLEQDAYVELVCRALGRLRPDIVTHRLTGDPAPGELLAPDWAVEKHTMITSIQFRLKQTGLRQGDHYPPPEES